VPEPQVIQEKKADLSSEAKNPLRQSASEQNSIRLQDSNDPPD
jgi:hypothetical protein